MEFMDFDFLEEMFKEDEVMFGLGRFKFYKFYSGRKFFDKLRFYFYFIISFYGDLNVGFLKLKFVS